MFLLQKCVILRKFLIMFYCEGLKPGGSSEIGEISDHFIPAYERNLTENVTIFLSFFHVKSKRYSSCNLTEVCGLNSVAESGLLISVATGSSQTSIHLTG